MRTSDTINPIPGRFHRRSGANHTHYAESAKKLTLFTPIAVQPNDKVVSDETSLQKLSMFSVSSSIASDVDVDSLHLMDDGDNEEIMNITSVLPIWMQEAQNNLR